MTVEPPNRARTITRLSDLPPLELRVVVCARLWREGPTGRAELDRFLADLHGPELGRTTGARLDDLLRLVTAHARRPIEFGEVGCEGAAGVECVLARLVALAAEGEREEAILISALLIRADLALELARRAMTLGHLMMRRRGALALLRA